MRGHPVLLEIALRNLIENALAHAPAGATIEVQLNATERWFQVCDNGGVGNATAPAPAGASGIPPPPWGRARPGPPRGGEGGGPAQRPAGAAALTHGHRPL